MITEYLAAAGSLWKYWNNPFLLRSVRSSWRGRSWRTALWSQVALLVLVVWLGSLGPAAFGARSFPEWLGGSWGGVILVFLSLAHFAMVAYGAGAARRGEQLTDEARRGTLEAVLVTPMNRAEIILKSAVYPFLTISLVAWIALPLYLLCAAVGQVPLATIAGFYVLVTLIAFRPPVRLRHSILAHTRTQQAAVAAGTLVALVVLLAPSRGGFWGVVHYGGLALSWLWELVGWLTRPSSWFALRLPPLLALLLLYPMHVTCGILMASAELEHEPRDYLRALAQVRFWYRLLLATTALGFAWEPLFVARDLAGDLGVPGGQAGALALVLCGAVALLAGSEVLETARTRLDVWAGLGAKLRLGRSAAAHVGSGVIQSISSVLLVPVAFVLACACAGVSPVDGSEVLGAGMLAAGTAVALCYGLGLLLWLLFARRRWLSGSGFVLCAAGLVALPWVGLSLVGAPAGGWLAALSPLASFAALTGPGGGWFLGATAALPPWYACLGIQLAAAAVLFAVDVLVLGRRLRSRRPTAFASVGVRDTVEPPRFDPLGWWERTLERRDNPIALQGWRGACRSGAAFAVPTVGLMGVLVGMGIAISVPTVAIGLTTALLRADAVPASAELGWRLLAFASAALTVCVPFAAALAGGTSFVDERKRQVFGFVLLTPLTAGEIVWGRMLALALPFALVVATGLPAFAAGLVLAPSLAAAAQVVHCLTWTVLVGCATALMGLSGALAGRVSDAGGTGRALVLWFVLELLRWMAVGITRWAEKGLTSTGQGLTALVTAGLLAGLGALALLMAHASAARAIRKLRERDPFSA